VVYLVRVHLTPHLGIISFNSVKREISLCVNHVIPCRNLAQCSHDFAYANSGQNDQIPGPNQITLLKVLPL
jgi:hypothetical protein